MRLIVVHDYSKWEMQGTPTLHSFLSAAFESRYRRNANYSLRAFARDLGVSSANLCRAMKGTRGFSPPTLKRIVRVLALSPEEGELCIALSESQFARSRASRLEAENAIQLHRLYSARSDLAQVRLISDWYHFALLALMDTVEFCSDLAWIVRRLGVNPKVVSQAIARLKEVGAISEVSGKFVSNGNFYIDPAGIPSSAVREFHRQIIGKAQAAIEEQGLDEREFVSLTFAFDERRMLEAKTRIRKFREEFELEFGPKPDTRGTAVMALGVQFFRLDKTDPQKRGEK